MPVEGQPPQSGPAGTGAPTDEDAEDQSARRVATAGMDDATARLSKEDVERLLDSMKQSEKNLQLWRFQQQQERSEEANEKDW